MDVTNFDFMSGLGTIEITFSTPGNHTFISWLDLDIDTDLNDFNNETGAAGNLPAASGQTWEIDEPGLGSLDNCDSEPPQSYTGDIFDNFLTSDAVNGSSLDNQIFFDKNVPCTLIDPIDEVSFAMGWDFVLAAGETATITLMVSETKPPGFHIVHSDPDSPADVYMSGFIDIVSSQECQTGETRSCNTGLLGVCADGTETCDANGFWGACVQDFQSSSEVCDGKDNDCDGDTDESCLNNAPSIPQLVFPADGQSGLNTSIEFIWKTSTDPDGDNVIYNLYVCEDTSFTMECHSKENIASLTNNNYYFAGSGLSLLIFGLVLAGGVRDKSKIVLLLIIVVLSTVLLMSCGGSGGGGDNNTPPNNEITQSVLGLNSGTTYFWKVVADDGNGGIVESEVKSFITQ
jgi:hypothetical protein